MTVTLISLDFQAPACETTIRRLSSVIGHGPDADVRIEHCSIGRQHCRIITSTTSWWLRISIRYTGPSSTEVASAAAVVRPGHQLAIGLLTFLVQLRPEVEPAAPVEETLLTEAR